MINKYFKYWSTNYFYSVSIIIISSKMIFAGGPPWRTDDPIPVDFKQHELYLFSTGINDDEGISGVGPAVEFNYGIFQNTQFHVVLPMAFDVPKQGEKNFGYGDTEVGVKYRFVEQTDVIPSIATFPIAELPTGNESNNLGNGKAQFYLPIWFQKDISNWTICTGGGYWINPGNDNKNWQFYGLQVQYNFSDNLYLGMETFHQTASKINSDGYTGLHIGCGIAVVKSYEILFSADAGNGITSYKHFAYYIGLYHEF